MTQRVGWLTVLGFFVTACVPALSPEPPSTVSPEHPPEWFEVACSLPSEQVQRMKRGVYPGRSPEITLVPSAPNLFGSFSITTHSGPWAYLQRVPLVFYGPGFIRSRGPIRANRNVTLADLVPTLSSLLRFRFIGTQRGRPIREALLPRRETSTLPRLIVTIVWDGGGWNVLKRWPDKWPYLATLMNQGTSVRNAIVGSSPSVTPAIHTTIGTGVWPQDHGIVDIPIRTGQNVADAYGKMSPRHLLVPTLADLYDLHTGNQSKVAMVAERGWHLGMIGHGAFTKGGDKDIAVFKEERGTDFRTNRRWYTLPHYLRRLPGLEEDVRTVDLEDGKLDGAWLGHRILADQEKLQSTPAWTLYQTRVLRTLIRREGLGADEVPDLLYTNFKEPDVAGHIFNMVNPEVGDILRHTDESLREIITFLNREVGRRQWVVVLTADHGQGPDPRLTKAWPISEEELELDLAKHFGGGLVQAARPTGLWLDAEALDRRDISEAEVSRFLLDYRLQDNVPMGATPGEGYMKRRNERLLSAAFPTDSLVRIWNCTRSELRAASHGRRSDKSK